METRFRLGSESTFKVVKFRLCAGCCRAVVIVYCLSVRRGCCDALNNEGTVQMTLVLEEREDDVEGQAWE